MMINYTIMLSSFQEEAVSHSPGDALIDASSANLYNGCQKVIIGIWLLKVT
jgi:hypothetical protein